MSDTDRVLTVENMTDVDLGFKLCRLPDGCLHLHIVPDDVTRIHDEPVFTLEDAPGMQTFLEDTVSEVDR